MLTSTQLKLFLLLVGVVAACVLVGHGGSIVSASELIAEIGGTSGFVSTALLLYEKYLWAYKPLKWLKWRPDLRGTWRGTLRPLKNAEHPEWSTEVTIYVTVRQTLTTLTFTAWTKKSSSRTIVAILEKDRDDLRRAWSVYANKPDIHEARGSAAHDGAFELQLVDDPPCSLNGTYWTDRRTAGKMDLVEFTPRKFDSYDHAEVGTFLQYEGEQGSWYEFWKPRRKPKE